MFESHAHLDFEHFDKDRNEIIKKCKKEGIEFIINVGVDKKSILNSTDLAEKYDMIFASAGFHPHDAKTYDREFLLQKAKHNKVVAIGEIGLDYYRNLSPKDIQREVFADQIQLAIKMDLPIIVHDRDAHDECLEILSKYNPPKVVFHCFSGDAAFADRILQKGWNISFTGTITYKNSRQDDVVRLVPLDRFFIETDSPYLTPVPNRGKRNSPLNLRYVIEKISEIRGLPPKKITEYSFENAYRFFELDNIK
ncbi:MAG: TatD family hydrolase [Candidatus Cloacimonetes bacterium]|nr:TatD family hydrolase [Candidatus Cloacimonadota bacterium]MCF7814826.1 TatD family hydrolase [Candidatus Cloacimonadota bacterium]MCF7883320.1 TatD family hydrolase [Candidatus Cloacimonadota bacterium]